MTSNHPAKSSIFCVTFQGGASVTTTAANSLLAERNAVRSNPGIVKTVRFVRPAE
ncbi:hypothetical protein ACRQ1B_28835 [Rhizobium panacihumi]|uniref:hypothetical protein n=1 Tax=Rhizobium panacihumi TaxID=2008450 RepID=UPI003D79D716